MTSYRLRLANKPTAGAETVVPMAARSPAQADGWCSYGKCIRRSLQVPRGRLFLAATGDLTCSFGGPTSCPERGGLLSCSVHTIRTQRLVAQEDGGGATPSRKGVPRDGIGLGCWAPYRRLCRSGRSSSTGTALRMTKAAGVVGERWKLSGVS
ncbi:hypothetical protein LX36DRAFT_197889 [Colletotrichum falcatum]|nr:hypothetical protein LX36DRAFT_197889 [Colletotrichum falcatum]